MKVKELIELLNKENPNNDVKMAVNPSWPFQCGISHVKIKNNIVYIVDSRESSFLDYEEDIDIFNT